VPTPIFIDGPRNRQRAGAVKPLSRAHSAFFNVEASVLCKPRQVSKKRQPNKIIMAIKILPVKFVTFCLCFLKKCQILNGENLRKFFFFRLGQLVQIQVTSVRWTKVFLAKFVFDYLRCLCAGNAQNY
jgi:hypothetical protein